MQIRPFTTMWAVALLCLVLGPASSNADEAAASIEYRFVARPAGLPGDLQPGTGTSLKFLSIKAIDGFTVDAGLWQPNAKQAAETTVIVMVSGSGGSYARAPNSVLGLDLSANGFAALAINTRQHDDKRNTDNFFDVGRDIDAAVRTVRSLGYRSIVLQGHSLGTIQVLFCAATHWEHDIKALVQLSPLGDLAWRSRYLQVQEEAKYRALSEAALRAAPTLPTGIKRVPRPILMVRDDGDTIVTPFDPHVLLAAATSPGSLVPSIKFIPLPDPKGPNPGGHVFADNAKPLAEAITSWLGSRQLQWEPGLDRDASTCARAHIDRVQYRGAHGRT